jgi:hypothetical protein
VEKARCKPVGKDGGEDGKERVGEGDAEGGCGGVVYGVGVKEEVQYGRT